MAKTTHIESAVHHINKPAYLVYSQFEDLTRFTAHLPEEQKANITATKDTFLAKIPQMQGMEMGLEIVERVPYSLVKCRQYGQLPLTFNLELRIVESGVECDIQMVFDAELPMMIKMFLEPKLKEAIPQMAEKMAESMNKA